MTTHWTYILKCKDNTLYTGYTTDFIRRLYEHKRGIGSKYTRKHGALMLVYLNNHETRSAAMKEEAAIKKLWRVQKLSLIDAHQPITLSHLNAALSIRNDKYAKALREERFKATVVQSIEGDD